MDALTLNLLMVIGVIIFFLVQGISYFGRVNNAESFFLYGRSLESPEYSKSFAAASTSLASVLFFFVTLGVQNGIYIFIAPITYIIGCFLYCKLLLPRLDKQGFFLNNNTSSVATLGTTLGNYIETRYQSKSVKYSVIYITFLGLLSILLIELFVGVTIFSCYLKEVYVDFALLIITIVVFVYTSMGGLVAVVKTDKVQFKLMLVASLMFMGWLIFKAIAKNDLPGMDDLIVRPIFSKEGFLLPYPIFFNILIVNLFLIPALLRTWQLAASSPTAKSVKNGIMRGIYLTTLLTTLFIFIGIFFFKNVFPSSEMSLNGMLTSLHQSKEFFPSFIVFPLFFSACVAALVSTADSSLIPILQSLYQDFNTANNNEWKHRNIVLLTLILLVIALVLYFVVFRILKFNLMSWLFTIFSLLIIATPSIVWAVIAPDNIVSKKSSKVGAIISLHGSAIIAITLSIIGNKTGRLEIVQLNSPIAAMFGVFCFFIVFLYEKSRRSSK